MKKEDSTPQSQRSDKHCFSWEVDAVVGPLLSLRTKMGPIATDKAGHLNLDAVEKMKTEGRLRAGSQMSLATSNGLYGEPQQTLIFLDWDDTVFPTYALFRKWKLPTQSSLWPSLNMTDELNTDLQIWRDALYHYLLTVCSLSKRVVIVTNARRPWVDDCMEYFAPNVKPLFEQEHGLHVVYARESISSRLQKDSSLSPEELDMLLTKAKYVAMRKEARAFYSQYPDQTWKNIISVGDAVYEHDAVQDVAFRRNGPARERLRLKATTTPANPSLKQLTSRLKFELILFPAYVYHDGDIDLNMNTPERLQALANALDMPEMTDVIATISEGCEEHQWLTDQQADELAMLVHGKVAS